jgi:hypothetical protein
LTSSIKPTAATNPLAAPINVLTAEALRTPESATAAALTSMLGNGLQSALEREFLRQNHAAGIMNGIQSVMGVIDSPVSNYGKAARDALRFAAPETPEAFEASLRKANQQAI